MNDERFKAWLTFWQFILGTVVLGRVTTLISHQIQTREIEIKEQEANAKFLDQAIQEDVGVRRRLAQYFSHVTRSDELRERWAEYSKLVDDEYTATQKAKELLEKKAEDKSLDPAARVQIEQKIEQLEKELSSKPIQANATAARVYLHVATKELRPRAEAIATLLRNSAITVPGIELVSSSPSTSELRYFRLSEANEANGIVSLLQANFPEVEAKYIPGYEGSTGIRPRHFEIWLAGQAELRGGR